MSPFISMSQENNLLSFIIITLHRLFVDAEISKRTHSGIIPARSPKFDLLSFANDASDVTVT
jgi:hypothetical protein